MLVVLITVAHGVEDYIGQCTSQRSVSPSGFNQPREACVVLALLARRRALAPEDEAVRDLLRRCARAVRVDSEVHYLGLEARRWVAEHEQRAKSRR